jgi:ubiquinone/menaquinone biosynthesis C-methylase UbiE
LIKKTILPFRSTLGFDDYVDHEESSEVEKNFLEWYKKNSSDYDKYLPLTFEILGCDENVERGKLYQSIDIKPGQTILEVGAGTGRDSVEISKRLGPTGILVAQDISPEILSICREKYLGNLAKSSPVEFIVSNVKKLPFPDETFDRVFHFGGLNTFGDITSSLLEIHRVTKDNGLILVGDEGLAPWLINTEFGKILIATNSQYDQKPPLECIPTETEDVRLEWFCSGAFYFITYRKCIRARENVNFDLEIPGVRGGSPRKRAYGVLEGISPELKLEIYNICTKLGISQVEFIENALRNRLNDNSKI